MKTAAKIFVLLYAVFDILLFGIAAFILWRWSRRVKQSRANIRPIPLQKELRQEASTGHPPPMDPKETEGATPSILAS